MNKKQRITFIILGFCSLALGISIILYNFTSNIIFFYSPTELTKVKIAEHQIIRIGGLVKEHSVHKLPDQKNEFILTDLEHSIKVIYHGVLPNLFRENQGMVAKGRLKNNIFYATELLAKHDENYMPKEVSDSLKKSGRWKDKK